MRTTLDIDDDILAAAKDLAKSADKTAGKIISELARKALMQPGTDFRVEEERAIYGIRPFSKQRAMIGDIEPLPHQGGIVTTDLVRKLMDEQGI